MHPSTALERWFLAHPRARNQTYLQHQRAAFGYGMRLLGAGLASLTHGLVPCLFETTASRTVGALRATLSNHA